MTDSGKRLLDILFDPEEDICVSPDKYGYHSIPLKEMLMGSFVLSPNNSEKQTPRFCNPSDIQLVAINPIKGRRNDENVICFRTFMIEMDQDSLAEQFSYVNNMGMPYSLCVFSGSKSLHYAISLTRALPSEEIWRFYAQWILNIMSRADQQAKNPSRSIRMAGNIRSENGNEMKLLQARVRVELEELQAWLSHFPGLMPLAEKRQARTDVPIDLSFLPEWVQNELIFGLDYSKGRNNRWFAIGYECGLQGWHEDDTIILLSNFFNQERDFSRKEWESAIKSGVRKARKNYD